ncbi:LPS export ABC transporter periplasmic protein LptC [Sphingomonas paeninsulae]|jgi:lipopolysaccharide export system protein LptC|uniref:LPS export ABC transporter periplasmic protein LptC n=1 Tax=Sphingomonas paeninsulae TaxID=2319844 RepID=A0A494TM81_SPHPE|nr:LPS export ABC transporter periplasmic protein LptC [Sphingomonas paeninsulae]AYJ86185.1 LPS export ABC transporter periplasmic protein LptC [Sphingomonas paeninsulae]
MSELAEQTRDQRRHWAAPGSNHDRVIKTAMIILPSAIGALAAVLLIAPLLARSEISFVLDKDKVALAKERMRVSDAQYRGQDDKGQPFTLHAGNAVQRTSRVPVVQMTDLSARMLLDDGPAVLTTKNANYNMTNENIRVPGEVLFKSQGGYSMITRGVGVDMKARTMASDTPVDGQMPLGTFSSDRMQADLNGRIVILNGRARLHIVQGAARAK